MYDRGYAIIVAADPAGNGRRGRPQAIPAARRGRIPSRELRKHRTIEPSARRRSHTIGTEVRLELIPRVSHRRMAVGDVAGPARHHDRLRRAVAAADDQVVAVQVELL